MLVNKVEDASVFNSNDAQNYLVFVTATVRKASFGKLNHSRPRFLRRFRCS